MTGEPTDQPPDAGVLKARVARRYGLLASAFDGIGPRLFSRPGQRPAELSEVTSGDRVLDAATGRGAVLFAALEPVGPAGHVVGIDISPQMGRLTGAEIAKRRLVNAEVRQIDAEALDIANDAFDSVLCGFGLFFLPDLRRALAESHRVLLPGGRFGATTDGRPDERWTGWPVLRRDFGVEPRVAARQFEDPTGLPATLGQAGFVDVRGVEEEIDLVYADEEEWWVSQHVNLEGTMAPEALARLKAAAFVRVRALRGADGIHRWSDARYNLARKPML